jgi:hypothetical protein
MGRFWRVSWVWEGGDGTYAFLAGGGDEGAEVRAEEAVGGAESFAHFEEFTSLDGGLSGWLVMREREE